MINGKEVIQIEVIELELKIFLMKDIGKEEALEKLSNLIDKTLIKTEKFRILHIENKYKYYTFTSLWPLEETGVYKQGNIYTFRIRTVDSDLATYFKKYLTNEYTNSIKVLIITERILPKKYIEKLYSITPAVAKFEKGYWKSEYSLEDYETRIKNNIIKKYNKFFNTKLNEDFELFNVIRFDNIKPISSKYKNINILADKLTLYVAENETAQDLAYFILGAGLLEMNSRGYGYCNYKWI